MKSSILARIFLTHDLYALRELSKQAKRGSVFVFGFVFVFFCSFAFAVPSSSDVINLKDKVSFDFKKVSVPEFSQLMFAEILGEDFIIANDVLNTDKRLTVKVRDYPKTGVIKFLTDYLKQEGIALDKVNNVWQLNFVKSEPVSNADTLHSSIELPTEQTRFIKGEGDSKAESVKLDFDKLGSYIPKHKTIPNIHAFIKSLGANVLTADTIAPIIYTLPDNLDASRFNQILALADTPIQSLTIRASIVEFSDTENQDTSIAIKTVFDLLKTRLNLTLSLGQALANSISLKNTTLDAVFSATNGDSRFNYLANPTIRVMDGIQASLLVGAEVPTRESAIVNQQGITTQSFQYRQSGLKLDVTPTILNNAIYLKLNQEISDFQRTQTSNIDSPTLTKRSAQTQFEIQEGEVILFAGLDEQRDTKTNTSFSLLPFIKSKNNASKKSNIFLFIEVQKTKPLTL